jgi:hypothetical protein
LLKQFGQGTAPVQNKSKGAGQILFHQFKGGVIQPGKFTDMAQIVANKRQIGFAYAFVFEPANLLDSPGMKNVATDGIDRIGGIND